MAELRFEHPLKVPADVKVTPKMQKRYDSGFSPSLTLDETLGYLLEESEKFDDAFSLTLYSNYERLSSPRDRRKLVDEPAVCCEVRYQQKSYYLVCHKWGVTEQNIYALHLALRAIHNMVRWGVGDYESLLQGFSSTQKHVEHPVSGDEQELVSRGQWLAILRLDKDATLEDANEAYRHYAKKAARSEEGLLRLNEAIAAARDYFANHG